MKFIPENIIDQKIEHVSNNKDLCLKEFKKAQSEFADYIFSDQFETLNTEEANLLLFIILVIFNAADKEAIALFNFEAFLEYEENNWTSFEDMTKLSWSKKLDQCFENHKQEDLLAFVEDMLSEDQEEISAIGKEFIFVTSKSFIDTL